MLIGKELPCILDDMLNEVNVSTINTMNKMTLTWVKRSKHPCFLLAFLFVLFSPRELLQCGTSSPCRGQISWFKQTVSSSVVSYPAKSHQWHCFFWVGSCGFSEEGPFLGRVLLWVPALCLAGQDPTRATVSFSSSPDPSCPADGKTGLCQRICACHLEVHLWGSVARE